VTSVCTPVSAWFLSLGNAVSYAMSATVATVRVLWVQVA